jgi:hypothetical protein
VGVILASIPFLIAAIIPFASGKTLKVSFYVIGIAVLVISAGVVR